MIFVDANVPMYLVGSPHPNQDRARATLNRLRLAQERLVTDVESYQEILHRFTAIRRPADIDSAFYRLDEIVDEVFSYGMPEIHIARDLISSLPELSARDALHAAVMRRNGISRILSYDAGFDAIPGVERME